jgi:site-specific DNA-adenine methylase
MRYPGGKGKCYQRLINMMPPHRVYIESHLGGGAVMRGKRPAAINIGVDLDPQVIARWQQFKPRHVELVQRDAVEFLRTYPFVGDELVYADPPYVASTRRRSRVYRYEYCDADHLALLEVLRSLPCRVMLSGYDNALYREHLSDWNVGAFPAQTHRGVREERVWTNFAPPPVLHDASYLGHSFRERQTIKRRHERWLARFDGLPVPERAHLLGLLNTRYPGSGAQP